MGQTSADGVAQLRAAGLRVTTPRVAVLNVLASAPHSDADTIATLVRDGANSISKQAVYDVLRALAEVGLLRRIAPAGSAARYELRGRDNHHHVFCRHCGAIGDVDCSAGESSCLTTTADDTHTFVIDEAELIYWGVCPGCRDSASARRPARN